MVNNTDEILSAQALLEELRQKAESFASNGYTIKSLLKDQFGVSDSKHYQFKDFTGAESSDFVCDYVRGSISLASGKIFTQDDADQLANKVDNLKFDL